MSDVNMTEYRTALARDIETLRQYMLFGDPHSESIDEALDRIAEFISARPVDVDAVAAVLWERAEKVYRAWDNRHGSDDELAGDEIAACLRASVMTDAEQIAALTPPTAPVTVSAEQARAALKPLLKQVLPRVYDAIIVHRLDDKGECRCGNWGWEHGEGGTHPNHVVNYVRTWIDNYPHNDADLIPSVLAALGIEVRPDAEGDGR